MIETVDTINTETCNDEWKRDNKNGFSLSLSPPGTYKSFRRKKTRWKRISPRVSSRRLINSIAGHRRKDPETILISILIISSFSVERNNFFCFFPIYRLFSIAYKLHVLAKKFKIQDWKVVGLSFLSSNNLENYIMKRVWIEDWIRIWFCFDPWQLETRVQEPIITSWPANEVTADLLSWGCALRDRLISLTILFQPTSSMPR